MSRTIELPQMREAGDLSDIAAIKVYRTSWGVVNDEARLAIILYDDEGSGLMEGALGENEVLQLARDALSLLPGDNHLKMVKSLNNEIRARRSWNQIGEKNGRQAAGEGSSRRSEEGRERETEEDV